MKNSYTKPLWQVKKDEELETLRKYLSKRYRELILNYEKERN
jgi:hypothetical protein